MTLALFLAASLAAPLLLLRGRALRLWLSLYAGAWLLFAALIILAHPFRLEVDHSLAHVAFGVLVTSGFWAFVAFRPPIDLRWSATRAAIAVAFFYAAAIPLMLRTPIDGDEPFYVLITESLVRHHTLDLSGEYRDLAHSVVGRTDLVPQLGDPVGPHGERYSRHEPFLPLLMIPGYLCGGLPGCAAVIALFGALLARSTVRLFEDEGIDDATIRAVFPLVALGPPIVFYAARIWPEVPAAFCFVEAVRGVRQRRPARWIPALAAFVLLKLRFLLVAVVLLVRALRRWRDAVVAAAILVVPLLVAWYSSGSPTDVHRLAELIPGSPAAMARGFFGLLLDGETGILFQAPIYIFGFLALARWREMPGAFRLGMSSSLVYLIYLVPRAEWHGGWSPPLRYIVFLMPLLALGAAAMWRRLDPAPVAVATAWTIALVVHGMAFPWRLFHIENGENFIGETLSTIWHSDFSRLFPSFIRLNVAAIVASALAVIVFFVFRSGRWFRPALLALILAAFFVFGRRPGDRIEFEDAHVIHRGGALYPYEYQVQRFLYSGGWIVGPGDSVDFLAPSGPFTLRYAAAMPSMIQLGGEAYALPATGNGYATVVVNVPREGRVHLRCLSGKVNLDRMDHD